VVPFRVLSRTEPSNRSRHASPNSLPLNLLQPLGPLFPTPILYFQQLAASFSKTPGVGYTRSNRFFEISKLRTLFRGPSCKLVTLSAPSWPNHARRTFQGLRGSGAAHPRCPRVTSHKSRVTPFHPSFVFITLQIPFPTTPLF